MLRVSSFVPIVAAVLLLFQETTLADEYTRDCQSDVRSAVRSLIQDGKLSEGDGLEVIVTAREVVAAEAESPLDDLAFDRLFDEIHGALGDDVYYFHSLSLFDAMKCEIYRSSAHRENLPKEGNLVFFRRANIKVASDMQFHVVDRLNKTGPDPEKSARRVFDGALQRLAHERANIKSVLSQGNTVAP